MDAVVGRLEQEGGRGDTDFLSLVRERELVVWYVGGVPRQRTRSLVRFFLLMICGMITLF